MFFKRLGSQIINILKLKVEGNVEPEIHCDLVKAVSVF